MPAAAATSRIVAAWYPFSKNNVVAAATIRCSVGIGVAASRVPP
jgi:hypothetical protein